MCLVLLPLVVKTKIIDAELSVKMKKMTGFRNIATSEYQKLEIEAVVKVIENGLDDLLKFCVVILSRHRDLIS
ncbi:MAG: hypothetical protein A2887_04235 [Alphaproteobacteria bacterium RIFCSPLOWO2_01_FULL_40_26]|nr:MAG: hypothetical protein A2887_04235 [Alphaproteobacteria bacterium RIFCSPLOWO2_01_FULL_40_26]OFX09395.1 MAG: hypothetical protein A3H30_01920 [Alphaproteobacteria bacterium RIFCSPLOWO2_02_FULL_40_19]